MSEIIEPFDQLNNWSAQNKYNPNVQKILNGPLEEFHKKIMQGDTVGNTVEIINYFEQFDPRYPFIDLLHRKARRGYIRNEFNWYLSQDLSIIGHKGIENNKIWQYTASKCEKKDVNSQYGYLVFSIENGVDGKSQFDHAKQNLIDNKLSRQSYIEYMRPTIHSDAKERGKNDFICTCGTQFLIRDEHLDMTVHMRSNSFFTGFKNDLAWQCYVYMQMYKQLKKVYTELKIGNLSWLAGSFHVYEDEYHEILDIYARHKQNRRIKQYYIYEIFDQVRRKSYVGRHFGYPYSTYLGSGVLIKRAQRVITRQQQFLKRILEICTKETVNDREIYWINKLNTRYPAGFNIEQGGSGGDRISRHPDREKIIKKISEGAKRMWQNPEIRKRIEAAKKKTQDIKGRKGRKVRIKDIEEIIIEDEKYKQHFIKMWNSSLASKQDIANFFGCLPDVVARRLKLSFKTRLVPGIVDLDTGIILHSMNDAAEYFGICGSILRTVLQGKRSIEGINITYFKFDFKTKGRSFRDKYRENLDKKMLASFAHTGENNPNWKGGVSKRKGKKKSRGASILGKNNPNYKAEIHPTQKDVEKAIKLFAKGLFFSDIAAQLNKPSARIRYVLKELGINTKLKNVEKRQRALKELGLL